MEVTSSPPRAVPLGRVESGWLQHGLATSGMISSRSRFDHIGGGISENNCSQAGVYLRHEVLWVWDVWFERGKCEIPRKELLVWGDDSVHLELFLECGGFLRRRAHS